MNPHIIRLAIQATHTTLDRIDDTLVGYGGSRLATIVELANLSAIVGNLFRGAISEASNGLFMANRPHTYPDLVGVGPNTHDMEIKVALETNNPKGHLIKPGAHITVRYVLGSDDGDYARGKDNRGDVVWIWEVRTGFLDTPHFNFSNTPGDSGKTAVINASGMVAMTPVFVDLTRCPFSPKGAHYRELKNHVDSTYVCEGYFRQRS